MNEEKQIVDRFAAKMLAKIEARHNRYAPLGWNTLDKKRLLRLLKDEIEELETAIDPISKADEAVDIANYAMFIHELYAHAEQR